MKSRFTKTRDGGGDHMAEGDSYLLIECYGTVQLTLSSPNGPQIIKLVEVSYVPNFMTK